MNLNDVQKLVYEEYKKNGYLDMWTYNDNPNLYPEIQRIADLAEAGLIGTEVSEVQEAIREYGYPMLKDMVGFELADVIIRCMNLASRKGIELEKYIMDKHKLNIDRGNRHGKEI